MFLKEKISNILSYIKLDGCFRKGKQSCLPAYVSGWKQLFLPEDGIIKLELSPKVMNTPSAATNGVKMVVRVIELGKGPKSYNV